MTKNLLSTKSGESILTYPHQHFKPLKKFYHYISELYKKTNKYFGIEGSTSDQVWFYGFYVTCISMIVLTLMITGILYGF
ncbi:DUF3961 domain-containing protein [Bacillus cereus]|uniref:DUF3961 domain-containing protein n=1 Tax=Bacillus cereus group TaxID=86661 RepID=UPI0011A6F316|nr:MULTISPECIES: DUF3961 domain-containing protein [Bacillus cereus group]MDF9626830.1 DUF3961 domain-containing protein [Bacillus cereus]